MIDNLSILLSHGLLMLAFWFLTQRLDVDQELPPAPDAPLPGFGKPAMPENAADSEPPQNSMRPISIRDRMKSMGRRNRHSNKKGSPDA
jgi:hypothetical protein